MQFRCGRISRNQLLQIFHVLYHWKNFENQSICGNDKDKSWMPIWPILKFTGLWWWHGVVSNMLCPISGDTLDPIST